MFTLSHTHKQNKKGGWGRARSLPWPQAQYELCDRSNKKSNVTGMWYSNQRQLESLPFFLVVTLYLEYNIKFILRWSLKT